MSKIPEHVDAQDPDFLICKSCHWGVDDEGWTTGDCAAYGKPDECADCHSCICDGSC